MTIAIIQPVNIFIVLVSIIVNWLPSVVGSSAPIPTCDLHFCGDPTLNWQTPLYIRHYQDIHFSLTNQRFITRGSHAKHDWKV